MAALCLSWTTSGQLRGRPSQLLGGSVHFPMPGGTQVGVKGLFPDNDFASDGALGIRLLSKSLPGLHL